MFSVTVDFEQTEKGTSKGTFLEGETYPVLQIIGDANLLIVDANGHLCVEPMRYFRYAEK